MSYYVTTNIRIEEKDYLRLKEEAFRKRKSLSAIIRGKLTKKKIKSKPAQEVINRIRKHVSESNEYLKGIDSVKVIREIRNQSKW